MKLLLYVSLMISFACLVSIFFIKTSKRKIKKYLIISSVGFYFMFAASVYFIHSANRSQVSELPVKAEGTKSQPIAEASLEVVETPKTKVAAAPKIDVKVRMTPSKRNKPNQKVALQFLVTNKSEGDILDLRMKFSRGELSDYFYLKEVRGNGKVYVFDNIVTLGDLKAGEDRKVQFNLISKNDVNYSGEIIWQVGNNYIVDENTKPLASLIHLPVDEEFEAGEEYDFADFDSLKSVAELEEEEAVVITADSNNKGEYAETTIDQNEEDSTVVEETESKVVIEEAYHE